MQEPPQTHCPAQDKAQLFSKGSSGWESHKVCSHPMFLCEHCISLNITGKNPENSKIPGNAPGNQPEDCHSMGWACQRTPKGHSQCSVPGTDCECTHQPNTQHREAVGPYLGKLSRFSAAALAACGSPRHAPSQPTPPGTRRSSSGSVLSLCWHLPLCPAPQQTGTSPPLGVSPLPSPWQGGGRHTNGHYLDWDPFGNVHDQLHIGVVVVVCPSRDGHIVICHLDVLCKRARGVVGATLSGTSLSGTPSQILHPREAEAGKNYLLLDLAAQEETV